MAEKIHIATITAFHALAGLPKPAHHQISIIKLEDVAWKPVKEKITVIRDFYIIAFKKNSSFEYGQHHMSSAIAFLHFMAPKQILSLEAHDNKNKTSSSGWVLLIHRDFLWDTSLAEKIRQYPYFSYDFKAVLELDEKQETTVLNVFAQMDNEQHQLKGMNTKDILIAQIELLLAYADRFYRGQRPARSSKTDGFLARLELEIDFYLQDSNLSSNGTPTIAYLSDQLHVSPNHLSRLVKELTGQSTQQLLHDKLISLAKEKLSASSFSVAEIAYQLGFKSPEAFSRLFKLRTTMTPSAFRRYFN